MFTNACKAVSDRVTEDLEKEYGHGHRSTLNKASISFLLHFEMIESFPVYTDNGTLRNESPRINIIDDLENRIGLALFAKTNIIFTCFPV